mmetsp:Transcript_12872/g.12488  ORF Transcript_12872/g.12488 Transcript_12872/m.12488 type:complete len:180 (-) Transcript_12872:44-583(-)
MKEQFNNFGRLSISSKSSSSTRRNNSGEKHKSDHEQSGKQQGGEAADNDNIDAFEVSFHTEIPISFSESPSPNAFGDDDFTDSFFMVPSSVHEFEIDNHTDHHHIDVDANKQALREAAVEAMYLPSALFQMMKRMHQWMKHSPYFQTGMKTYLLFRSPQMLMCSMTNYNVLNNILFLLV